MNLGLASEGFPSDLSRIDWFTRRVGHAPMFAMWYQNWDSQFSANACSAVYKAGSAPIITWEPWNRSLDDIVSGMHDDYINSWARSVASFGRQVYIRFAHEMNGNWYPWGNNPQAFRKAWAHIQTKFNQHNTKVSWIWSPNVQYDEASAIQEYYPSGQVDAIGIDGYNFGHGQWRSFREIFQQSYKYARALNSRVPILITETACADEGGNKADWISSAFAQEIPKWFPDLLSVIWFDYEKTENGVHYNWKFDSTPDARKAFLAIARKM